MPPGQANEARALNTVVAGIFIVLGLAAAFEATKMRYYSSLGPGPGFFPLWLGGALALFSFLWLVQIRLASSADGTSGLRPGRAGALRIAAVLGSLAFVAFTIELIGFRLAMFAMLGFVLLTLGRQRLLVTLVVAAAGSFGAYYVMGGWLGVSLPNATLPWLADLGL
ncbi:MAG TPA: tripartite tricarboxylate transporter TctB family protein [Candidatus Limnocylindria bacterium]|nr:tripartite tricarboxylate transporter TctB family protein [Candidatus Limnocylindria bacterium]